MHVHAGHGHSERTRRVLRLSLVATMLYIVLLVVAGIRAHSLALLSEAGHNLSDFLALLLSLLAVSFFIFYEAFRRWQHPEHVQAGTMIGVAAAGVVMNGVIALLLWRAGRDVNVRSAFLHEIGDTLSTAAVIA